MADKKRTYRLGSTNEPNPCWWGSEETGDSVNVPKVGWQTYSRRKSGKINKFLTETLGLAASDAEVNKARADAARRQVLARQHKKEARPANSKRTRGN
jgi:hypothetical protein